MLYPLLGLFGLCAGVTTLLFGFGGGFFAVPLFYALLLASHGAGTAVAQHAMQIAVATSATVMIFSSALATWRHHRAGSLHWDLVRPLAPAIALGALLGAWVALYVTSAWLRWLFITYLALSLLDAWLRPGFVHAGEHHLAPLGRAGATLVGLPIGALAALLGVGGSVMTVPLMRRRGASMRTATAMANPLSLPMSLAATLVYALLPAGQPDLGPGLLGFIDLRAALVMTVGAWLGMHLAAPLLGRISDSVHARTYLALLACVLLVMLVNGR
ncbi:sulfite exporter TauE/SafE family protein [Pseudomonas mosselii]|uniref:sulfite exporter TauE/SafE family protein n=1 Tax=Pseudomonas mosselii TaxID=78327 RepID=UPI0021D9A3D9|nr:sulfite exporter TauE/SafE family protein [Pseudomonas mosselii]MCU9532454.1 sulfite exporter TauE/SafE family protein [Pseudomonas mosselii]MCU9539791.1 sulfite exporter TauE/SafE family protein [Pseudomonas mosselii]MCU9545556.1 sulfite exporter TauE/SafE family protein [Pseudomonas mosselii]MCU9551325.1 sulfite exporter TauE/SafE family protein [Pseudomonas mosselii]